VLRGRGWGGLGGGRGGSGEEGRGGGYYKKKNTKTKHGNNPININIG